MPESHRLYLDQMLRIEVAQALSNEGYDVLRAVEVGQDRADDYQILQKAIAENRILVTLVIGYRLRINYLAFTP